MFVHASLVICALVAHSDDKTDRKERDDPLAGCWIVKSFVYNALDISSTNGKTKMCFKSGKLNWTVLDNKTVAYTYKFDPAGKPASADLVIVEGPSKGAPTAGIYEIRGDELTLCLEFNPANKRPKVFESPKDSTLGLVVLRREKR